MLATVVSTVFYANVDMELSIDWVARGCGHAPWLRLFLHLENNREHQFSMLAPTQQTHTSLDYLCSDMDFEHPYLDQVKYRVIRPCQSCERLSEPL